MIPPRWIVPLESGQVGIGDPRLVVTVTDDLCVDIETENCVEPFIWLLLSLTACQLGQALQDASRWCGAERARREAKKGPER